MVNEALRSARGRLLLPRPSHARPRSGKAPYGFENGNKFIAIRAECGAKAE
jgi:hypothetical protein